MRYVPVIGAKAKPSEAFPHVIAVPSFFVKVNEFTIVSVLPAI